MKLHTNTKGFAHPVLLVVVLVGIIGLIAFAGQQVVTKNRATKQDSSTTAAEYLLITADGSDAEGNSGDNSKTIDVSKAGSAAAEATQRSGSNAAERSLPEKKQLSTKYDVSTPLGSLSQMISDAKARRFSNILYFITPRLMFRAYDAVQAQDLNDFAQKCQSNGNCNLLLITDIAIDKNHILEEGCHGESYPVECKKLSTTVAVKDGKLVTEYYKTVGYGHHKVSLYMLRSEGSPNWILDKITVDNYTL